MTFPPSSRPLYREVAEALRGLIKDAHFPPGSDLPSELTLSTRFGVGRDAVRDGLALLEREGLIECRRGRRARVAEMRVQEFVMLGAGEVACARMPTEDERRRSDIPVGVPVLVVGDRIYPANVFALVVAGPGVG
jgi:DNA-binding FadR family transcriptional regulator